jgi:Reverse transcriptase (RNA-dependent DNA polymerase)
MEQKELGSDGEEVEWENAAGSSSSPDLMVWINGTRHVVRGDRGRCTAALDPISKGRLEVDKLRSLAQGEGAWSEELEMMWQWTTTPVLANRLVAHLDGEMPRPVSRGFSREDVAMLESSGVLLPLQPRLVATGFKVRKSSGLSRFVWDGREFNSLFKRSGLKTPEMCLPRITEIVEPALKYPYAAARDASAFFYQFPVCTELARLFGVKICSRRGAFSLRCMKVTPMGVCFVPAYAQRCANSILQILRNRVKTKRGWEARCWVDNFLIFADSPEVLQEVLTAFDHLAQEIGLLLKPAELSVEGRFDFLGLSAKLGKEVRMSDEVVHTLEGEARFGSVREVLAWTGLALYANFAVGSRPLCLFPGALASIRKVCRLGATRGWDSDPLLSQQERGDLQDLGKLLALSQATTKILEDVPNAPVVVWSDAAMVGGDSVARPLIAGLLQVTDGASGSSEDVDLFVLPHNCPHIGEAEFAAMATAATLWEPPRGSTYAVDNQGVVRAALRGHSSNSRCDALLAEILPWLAGRRIAWVPSAAQRADGLTRGLRPCAPWHPRGGLPRWRI